MKKRILTGLLALCLLLSLLPAQVLASTEMTSVNVLDQISETYRVTDADTEAELQFSMDIPEDGSAVLVFFSTTCPNSQHFFSQLNQQDWVRDSRIRIYAVDSGGSTEEIRQFRETYAPDIRDSVTWYAVQDGLMTFGCWKACGMTRSTIYPPMVAVLKQTPFGNYFRWIGDRVLDAEGLGQLVVELCNEVPKEDFPQDPDESVDITVSGMVDYDAAQSVAWTANQLRYESNVPQLNWNSTLTELAIEWAAAMPLLDENPYLMEQPNLPDGTTVRDFIFQALPECGDFLYWTTEDSLSGLEIEQKIQNARSYVIQKRFTQLGIGCYKTDDTCFWAVFITQDLNQTDPVSKSGAEFRDYTFRCPWEKLPVITGPLTFRSYLKIGQTGITEVNAKSMNCIRDVSAVLRPDRISEQIYDSQTGKLIATAKIWEDGKITVTGVAPGSGTLEVWAYAEQREPLTHAVTISDGQNDRSYNISTEVVGNGTVSISTDHATENSLVTLSIQPDHRWELESISFQQDSVRTIDPVRFCLALQEDGSYNFRMMAQEANIRVTFRYIRDYPVNVSWTGNGEVSTLANREPGTTGLIGVRPEYGWMVSSMEWDGEPADWYWKDDTLIAFVMPEHPVSLHVSFAEIPAKPHFTDVPAGEWYETAVAWALERGITAGTSATTFSPNASCTRAQVVTFLWRAAGQPEPTSTENPFTDVTPADYFYKPVLWAVENGITAGLNAITFGPNTTCTRGQVVTFLWRTAGKPATVNAQNDFSDVTAADYFYEPVLWAVENNITAGIGNGKFAPSNPCTRGQVVTFLFRAMQ